MQHSPTPSPSPTPPSTSPPPLSPSVLSLDSGAFRLVLILGATLAAFCLLKARFRGSSPGSGSVFNSNSNPKSYKSDSKSKSSLHSAGKTSHPNSIPNSAASPSDTTMSRPLTKSNEKALFNEFREVTNASATDATKWLKKYKYNIHLAIEGYFNSGANVSVSGSSTRDNEKKIGEIWEKYKDPSNPKLITIDGTLQMAEDLDIDPASDMVLFCLGADLGSKATGEFEKEPFVRGWMAIDSSINSVAGMKKALPKLRKDLNSNAAYFKKVYMHTFDLSRAPGARVLALDTALDLWSVFIPPALAAQPSALSKAPADSPSAPATNEPPAFGQEHLDMWLDFQRQRGKAISKDTWSLFVDFVRTIDAKFEEYDETAAWPSTIDEFVEFAKPKL